MFAVTTDINDVTFVSQYTICVTVVNACLGNKPNREGVHALFRDGGDVEVNGLVEDLSRSSAQTKSLNAGGRRFQEE